LVLLHGGIVYDTYPKVNPNLNYFFNLHEACCLTKLSKNRIFRDEESPQRRNI
jgi:hypothetical protein